MPEQEEETVIIDDDQYETHISTQLDAVADSKPFIESTDGDRDKRLSLLFDIPLEFADEHAGHSLRNMILDKAMEMIPGAERGALMVVDPVANKLALRASVPENDPPLSRTLIQRAAQSSSGFIWGREEEFDPSASITALGMQTGMYAPLLWQGDLFGVICVDSKSRNNAFTADDLRFLLSVAHYGASALANQRLQNDLQQNNTVLQRLLTNFSPQLRSKLLDKARSDELAPGGEKSNVTLLLSDIRGFTNLTTGMDASHVVDLLNEYFSALVAAIFENNGTIDKFIGDAILAVFGSPEKDDDQQINALKAAKAMQDAMVRVNQARHSRGAVTCELGIGLHYGEVLHGFIGADDRLEFTVIGETVNKTARFCDGAGKGQIVISPELNKYVSSSYKTERISIPTKHEGNFETFRVQ